MSKEIDRQREYMMWALAAILPSVILAFGAVVELPGILKKRADARVEMQRLKTEEARELRLAAEAKLKQQ